MLIVCNHLLTAVNGLVLIDEQLDFISVFKKSENSVVALVDYNPGQTDLLAFQKGDVGRLIKKAETGWWFIGLKGFEGWVPASYWEEYKVIFCLNYDCHCCISSLARIVELKKLTKSRSYLPLNTILPHITALFPSHNF